MGRPVFRPAPTPSWKRSTPPSASITGSTGRTLPGQSRTPRMLAETGILTAGGPRRDHRGSRGRSRARSRHGKFTFSRALEDIHMNVESRLKEMIGDAAGRLHTARSRNDQVATDFRLYVRDAIDTLLAQIKALQLALVTRAEDEADTIMPGFTHLQSAQPVTFGHHLLAYVEMLGRDAGRLRPMRASGSTRARSARRRSPARRFPIDRDMTAKALGFDRPTANSLDAVVRPRLHPRDAGGREHLRHAPVALRRGAGDLVVGAVRLRPALATSSRPAPRSCRRSAIRTPPSWCAPRSAASSAR